MKSKAITLLVVISIFFGCNNNKRESKESRVRKHIASIEANLDSLSSAETLAVMCTTFGKEKTTELFNKLAPEVRNSDNGKIVEQYLLLNKDLKVGDKFVDFEMLDSNGQPRKLSEFEGKIILLEFWASWCGPCLKEMPHLKKTYDNYHKHGFEVFAVSLDVDKENWLKAIEEKRLNWTHVTELKSIANTAGFIYGVSSIPNNFLIDEEGIIRARGVRGDKLDKALKKMIKK
ncbi:TlpA family protein disulfide reductase [Bacteroides sp. 214]|uniref:peroxiredoxin family protein n=1 Tax=Bacteroides sp. 214 TaxID=2302935 RepID=UPI0013D8709E|nr:TlpA disulfide reductase family protein [Bacteroides sp. 214]NDW11348.1 TlpA family protein disulfide reductase [Bacteroides sp. 214]